MARIHTRKAAKDYPGTGIKKGDPYYFVKIKTGPYSSRTIRSLTRPKRWELTTSDFYRQLWPIEDEGFASISEASELHDVAELLRQLGEEQQEKLDNMPEGLQQGDTGQQIQERIDGCEQWAGDIETAADELETKLSEFDEAVEAYRSAKAEYENAMGEYDPEGDDAEPEEPDVPDCLTDVDPDNEQSVTQTRQALIDAAVEEAESANPGID